MSSPDNRVSMVVSLNDEGALTYEVERGRRRVIERSALGITRQDQAFESGLSLVRAGEMEKVVERYDLFSGNHSRVESALTKRALTFRNSQGAQLVLDLAASSEGVAFRYRFPESDSAPKKVMRECTSFKVSLAAKGWLQPYHKAGQYTPAYEDFYFPVRPGEAPASSRAEANGWAFPALFEIPAARSWALISESETDGSYAACHLTNTGSPGEYRISFPSAEEGTARQPRADSAEPIGSLPWTMPWRVIVIGERAAEIAMSTLITDLAEPSQIDDTSWIRPGRSSWSWWTFPEGPNTFDRYSAFTELARKMDWEHTLFDGGWWDVGLKPLAEHAATNGVRSIAWSFAGDFYSPANRARKLDELKSGGASGVKADFWCSDRQEAMAAMQGLFKDAAERQMLVNLHGCTLPRGWHRTWPNFITAEAVLGAESYFYEPKFPEKAAELNCVLPFTRNVAGPMDYTPVAGALRKYPRQTTLAHELATAIVFTSGIICFADSPELFERLPSPAQAILREAPARWDESKCLAAEPGRLVVFARRSGGTWFLAGLNGAKTARRISLDLRAFRGFDDGVLISEGVEPSMQVAARQMKRPNRWRHEMAAQGGFILKLER